MGAGKETKIDVQGYRRGIAFLGINLNAENFKQFILSEEKLTSFSFESDHLALGHVTNAQGSYSEQILVRLMLQ